jgi:hypothetical protein
MQIKQESATLYAAILQPPKADLVAIAPLRLHIDIETMDPKGRELVEILRFGDKLPGGDRTSSRGMAC